MSSKIRHERNVDQTKNDEYKVPFADGTAKLSGRDYEVRESTPRREQIVRSEDLKEGLQGNSERSQPTETKDDAEARRDFWSIQVDFTCRHHTELRVQLCVPLEETFLIPTEIH